LDELGFVWDPLETDWEEGLAYLTIYKEREGHCRVPHAHKENGVHLGHWVARQRERRSRMSQERTQKLDELGFVWNARRTLATKIDSSGKTGMTE
jgi:Helicase associated domain